jgi:hypothetical protein
MNKFILSFLLLTIFYITSEVMSMSSRFELFWELFFTVRDSLVEVADLEVSESVGEDDFSSHRLRVLDVTEGLGTSISESRAVRVDRSSRVVHSVDVAFSRGSFKEASS